MKRKAGIGEMFFIAGQSNAQGACNVNDNPVRNASGTVLMDAVRVSPDFIERPEGVDPNAFD